MAPYPHDTNPAVQSVVWTIGGYGPDPSATEPQWVMEFGPGTPPHVVLDCIQSVARMRSEGVDLPLSAGGFYREAVPVLGCGWQQNMRAVANGYTGPSLFHVTVLAPDGTMAVEHLRDGWEMSLRDHATWRLTGNIRAHAPGWEILAHASTPTAVIAACTDAMTASGAAGGTRPQRDRAEQRLPPPPGEDIPQHPAPINPAMARRR